MILTIDPASSVPMYKQIVDQVVYRIASGDLEEGDQLPSIRWLSMELRINPNTVIKAYRELELLGYAVSQQGKGYFVPGKGVDPARLHWKNQALDEIRRAVEHAVTVGTPLEAILSVIDEVLKRKESENESTGY